MIIWMLPFAAAGSGAVDRAETSLPFECGFAPQSVFSALHYYLLATESRWELLSSHALLKFYEMR
jgi:hypothetical protein